MGAVHRAVADFAEGWNKSSPSILFSLPNELQVACLSKLSFTERVTASHVSRSWRRLLLDTPTLWTSVPKRKRYEDFATLLDALVSRSGSAPLDIEHFSLRPDLHARLWDTKSTVYTKARELLESAMPRIQSLSISLRTLCTDDPILWQARAPMLESLHVESSQFAVIPELWWQSYVPCLRRLRLSVFSLPSSHDPANRLEVFEAGMSGHDRSMQADARLLFLHFPHLVSLRLHSVSDLSLLPNTRPPASLRDIRLDTRRPGGAAGDIAPVLRLLRNHPLSALSLNDFAQFTLSEAVEYFASKAAAPWELTTSIWKPNAVLHGVCDTGPLKLEMGQILFIPPESVTFGARHFQALHSLTLAGFWIPAFLRAKPSLPSLTSLTLSDRIQEENNSFADALRNPDCPPLRVPALKLVAFAFDFDVHSDGYPVRQALQFLRTRLRYNARRLDRVTLTTGALSPYLSRAARILCPFASEVCCEGPGGDITIIAPEDAVALESGEATDHDDDSAFERFVPLGS
ncbi:hypothetical protein AURDEDRAFT_154667 [Auricularia subglabra TFB-10046 SS5]|nr:hypothetical protein AURDEDRAFT_154667 [Auricularia subglabra TFB-10046 SS5]